MYTLHLEIGHPSYQNAWQAYPQENMVSKWCFHEGDRFVPHLGIDSAGPNVQSFGDLIVRDQQEAH